MSFTKVIYLKNGNRGMKPYYYWDEFDTWEEAQIIAKRIKEERKVMGIKVRYTIVTADDSWFLPVTKFVLYIDKRLKI